MITQEEIDHLANSMYRDHIGKISESANAIRELTLKLKEVGKQEDLIKLNDLMRRLGEEYTETLEYFKNVDEDSYNTSYRNLIFQVSERIPNREQVLKLEQNLFSSIYQSIESSMIEKDNSSIEDDCFEECDSKKEKKEKDKKEGLLNKFYKFFDRIFA